MENELFTYTYDNNHNTITKVNKSTRSILREYPRDKNSTSISIEEVTLINIFDENFNESIELSGKSCFLDHVYVLKTTQLI